MAAIELRQDFAVSRPAPKRRLMPKRRVTARGDIAAISDKPVDCIDLYGTGVRFHTGEHWRAFQKVSEALTDKFHSEGHSTKEKDMLGHHHQTARPKMPGQTDESH